MAIFLLASSVPLNSLVAPKGAGGFLIDICMHLAAYLYIIPFPLRRILFGQFDIASGSVGIAAQP